MAMDPPFSQNPWVPFDTFQKSVGSAEPTAPTLTTPLSCYSIGLENADQDCWYGCNQQQGKCSWCGQNGYCCKDGTPGNGCDGSFGGVSIHACTLSKLIIKRSLQISAVTVVEFLSGAGKNQQVFTFQ